MDDMELAQGVGSSELYLTFAVGDEDYGLEISVVTEIINVQTITDVPELPAYIKGIINLRGKIIPVMDVRIRFNKEQQAVVKPIPSFITERIGQIRGIAGCTILGNGNISLIIDVKSLTG